MVLSKYKKRLAIVILTVITTWGIVVTIDYQLCKADKEPLFAIYADACDIIIYRGLGYNISKGAWDPNWEPGKEPLNFSYSFNWGW